MTIEHVRTGSPGRLPPSEPIWAQIALILLAIIVFITSRNGAPLMYRGLTNWWAPIVLGWTISERD